MPGFGSFGLPLLSRFRTGSPGRLNVGRGFFVSTLVGGLLIPATVASAKSAFGTSRHFAAPQNLVASLIGRLGSSAFRLSTSAVSMSLTGSRFSSESAPRPLYGAFLVKKFKQRSPSFFFVSFFVRFEGLFLRPDRGFAHAGARRSCQGWPLYQPCGILQPC